VQSLPLRIALSSLDCHVGLTPASTKKLWKKQAISLRGFDLQLVKGLVGLTHASTKKLWKKQAISLRGFDLQWVKDLLGLTPCVNQKVVEKAGLFPTMVLWRVRAVSALKIVNIHPG
jgi:hypothetical protein